MAEPKSGRRYQRGKEAVHIASSPGEAPATDTGTLTGSIMTGFLSSLEAIVGTPVEYALYLESGTRNMSPRPAWQITAEELIPDLTKLLEDELKGK